MLIMFAHLGPTCFDRSSIENGVDVRCSIDDLEKLKEVEWEGVVRVCAHVCRLATALLIPFSVGTHAHGGHASATFKLATS